MIFRYRRTGRELPLISPRDDSHDHLLFNQDQHTLTKDIVFAILQWMRRSATRHHKDTRPKIGAATKRRGVLIQWSIEKRAVGNILFYQKLRAEITKGIHVGAKNLWEGKFNNTHVAPKVYFGRYELRQLLDWESIHSLSREVSEQHEMAWCLGCVCGIRPCSLAEVPRRPGQYLRWRDVAITRALAPGKATPNA